MKLTMTVEIDIRPDWEEEDFSRYADPEAAQNLHRNSVAVNLHQALMAAAMGMVSASMDQTSIGISSVSVSAPTWEQASTPEETPADAN